MHTKYRVLRVAAEAADGSVSTRALREAGGQSWSIVDVSDCDLACAQLATSGWDAVLLDATGDAVNTNVQLQQLIAAAGDAVPVIVAVAPGHETAGATAIAAGAADYLVDGQVTGSMVGRLLRAVVTRWCADRTSAVARSYASELTARYQADGERLGFQARLLDAAGEAVVATAMDGSIMYWNTAAERLYGWTAEQAIGRNEQQLMKPHLSIAQVTERLKRGSPWSGDYDMHRRDGTRFHAHVTNAPIIDGGGTLSGVISVATDLTERDLAEDALRRSEERFRLVVRATRDVVWDHDFHTDSTWYSEDAAAVVGLPPDRMPVRLAAWREHIHPDDLRAFDAALQEATANGSDSFALEYRFRRGDGDWRWFFDRGYITYDEAGRPARILGAVMDLTERRRTEEALRENEERLRLITETAGDVFYLAEPDPPRMLHVSASYERIWGRPRAEVYGDVRRFLDVVHPDDVAATEDALTRRMNGEEVYVEYRIIRGGDVRWIAERSVPLRDSDGRLQRVVGTAQDITDQKLAEQALRRNEAKLSLILDTVTDAITIVDASGRITFANRAAETVLGLKASTITSRGFDDPTWRVTAVDGGALDSEELPAQTVLRTGMPVYDFEHAIEWPDGRRMVLSVNAAPILGVDGSTEGVVATIRDATSAKAAAERLRFQASLLDAVGDAVSGTDLDGTITYWNRHAEVLTGWSLQEVLGRPLLDIIKPDGGDDAQGALDAVTADGAWSGELDISRRDGRSFPAFVSAVPVRNEAGLICGIVGAATDLSGVKRLEQELQHAQRLEAVGRLAGGIAHDFNNLLTVIRGYADMVLSGLPAADPLHEDTTEIVLAADRAARLTSQLLAFSRKQVLEPRVLDLGELLSSLQNMLGRLIGEDIEMVFAVTDDLARVRADPGQIEQVIMNLVINARDAMPAGGRLQIGLDNAHFPANTPAGTATGPCVRLTVSDNGSGMSVDTLPHIFEPFYTTKVLGSGVGLGLSTVYGIVRQSGGHIEVRSAIGEGTTFRIYLPPVDAVGDAPRGDDRAAAPGRGETILLVEDEHAVRALAVRVLQGLGYHVLAARDGVEALQLASRESRVIDLLLTDVIMPAMSGPMLAARVHVDRPGTRVLYMSGYTADMVARRGVFDESQHFLEKPFAPAVLANRVRDVLDNGELVTDASPREENST